MRSTLTPRARAAWALPPEAWIQLPALVLGEHVAEDERGADEPEERGVDAEGPDVEVADEDRRRASGPAALQVRCGKPSVM